MTDDQEFPSEEMDERDRRLLQDLHLIYQTDPQKAQHLARMRKRFLEQSDLIAYNSHSASQLPGRLARTQPERLRNMHTGTTNISRGKAWQRNINAIAAILFVIVLVGALLLVLNSARQSRVAGSSHEQASVSTGTWSLTGSMHDGRQAHTATLLANGLVLIAGGVDKSNKLALASAEVYDPATGKWSLTGSMHVARIFQTATRLPDGKVLVAGGIDSNNKALASTEVYDPSSGTWSLTGSMSVARQSHTATLLPDGKVLVVGGYGNNNASLASAEVYDPATGKWSLTGSMQKARVNQTATLLKNGLVLVAGGYDYEQSSNIASAEVYDPATGKWSSTGSMHDARGNHTATLLDNGKVLVAGGLIVTGTHYASLASAELYNPASGTWSLTGSLHVARNSQTATLLPNGAVLVAGGIGKITVSSADSLASAELYNPSTGTWSLTGSMHSPRGTQTATLLPNGSVLVTGGYDSQTDINLASAELYG